MKQAKYSCQVETDNQVTNSKEITLEVKYNPITEKFMKKYAKHNWPTDPWPPKIATEFINLALIKRDKSVTEIPEYQYDVDDIIKAKERVKYESVFSTYRSGELLLVEGRPGSGKTTLMHKQIGL